MFEITNYQYLKCGNCQQIEPQTDWSQDTSGRPACKHCKQINVAQVWPSAEITEFISLSLIYSYNSRVVGENSLLMNQMAELKSRIDLLEGATDPMCPTCGQPLTKEHFHQTLATLTKEGTERGDRYRANRKMEDASSDKLKLFAMILCCTAAEMILEDHLFVLAWTNHLQEESEHVMGALFEAYQGRSGRLSMFKRMNGQSYKDLCASLGYGKAYDDWEKVTKVRNKLLHGDTSVEGQNELMSIGTKTLNAIFEGLLEVSRLDQNDYTSRFSYKYKFAVGQG